MIVPSLHNRGILIAGGSTGIGKAVAKSCVEAGADVVLCARSAPDLAVAKEELEALKSSTQQIFTCTTDVSDATAVKAAIQMATMQMPRFTGLVNCAAVLGPTGLLEETDMEDWIKTISINLIGTAQLCHAVLPHFRRHGYGKIINFSGGGATAPRPRFSAYAASKTAVVRLTETLAGELKDTRIDINAIAPGAVNTRMLQEVLEASPEQVGQAIYNDAVQQRKSGGTPPEKAAGLCVALLSAESDGITGRLISAVWDPWPSLGAWRSKLMGNDIYTLRRIVPEDRGITLE